MPISKINNAGLGTIDQINTGVTGYSLGAGNASLMKNRLINGACVIDQRNAGASVSVGATTTYTVDRFCINASQASKLTAQQNAGSVTPPSGFTKYLGITSSSAYSVTSTDTFTLQQRIEGFNAADLGWGTANAKTVTLSFQVYSSLTGTFGGSIENASVTRAYPFTYSIPVANTWTTISVTIAGDTTGTWATDNSTWCYLNWGLGVGSTLSGTAGSWAGADYRSATGATSVVGTSGATFYITGIQLEVGSSATGFEYVNYQTSLANCQRYFWKSNQSGANGNGGLGGTFWNSTTIATSGKWPTTMRAAPTLTRSAGANGYGDTFYVAGVSTSATGTISTLQLSTDGVFVEFTGSSGTVGYSAYYNGALLISAEL